MSNQTKFAVLSRGPRLWNRLLNQKQKNMAYINDFKNSVKTSLLYLENEIIYFKWNNIFLNLSKKNSGQKFRVINIDIVYYLSHNAWGVTLSPTGFFGKWEKICTLLRIWSYLLKVTRGERGEGFWILHSVRDYSRRCFGLSCQENSWTSVEVIVIRMVLFSFLA